MRGERTPFTALLAQAEWLGQMATIVPSADAESLERISAAADREAELSAALDCLGLVFDPLVARLEIKWPEGDDISLKMLVQRTDAMCVALDRFGELARLTHLSAELQSSGLWSLVAMLDAGELLPEKAVDEFLYATAEARWETARNLFPGLDELAYLDRHALVEAFRGLEV